MSSRRRSVRPPFVMVVEDDPDTREVLTIALEARGWRVVTARHGQDAIERLKAPGAPKPDAIVLDLMMPVMDGLEFLRRRARDAWLGKIPVVVTSALGELVATPGAQAVLPKPFELSALLASLTQLCEQQQHA